MEIPGNLYTKIKKLNLESKYTIDEKVWMSDFQSENSQCPMHIRTLILKTFENRSNKKNKKK